MLQIAIVLGSTRPQRRGAAVARWVLQELQAQDHPGPCLLDVRVAPLENCYPMIPAGRGHHEMMLSDTQWYRDEGLENTSQINR